MSAKEYKVLPGPGPSDALVSLLTPAPAHLDHPLQKGPSSLFLCAGYTDTPSLFFGPKTSEYLHSEAFLTVPLLGHFPF